MPATAARSGVARTAAPEPTGGAASTVARRHGCRRDATRLPAEVPDCVHRRFASAPSCADLELLVRHHLPLADAVVVRFPRVSAPLEDLRQVAYEALIGAITRFDPDRGVPFAAFATVTITGALKRYVRDTRWAVSIPRRSRDLSSPVRRAREQLEQELGRAPCVDDIARWLGLSVLEVMDVLLVDHDCDVRSLEEPTHDGRNLAEALAAPAWERDFERTEDLHLVEQLVAELSAPDRTLLELYYGRGWSQSEIARWVGVSQMQVSRELRRIVGCLRSRTTAA